MPIPEEYVAALAVGLIVDRRGRRRLPAVLRPVGVVLLAHGIVLNVQAAAARGPDALDDPAELVTTGPHAWSRNPMYVGWSEIHLGLALVSRSPRLLAMWPAASLGVHRAVLDEERMLAERFGASYDAYRRRVPRYVPFPGRARGRP